MRTMVFCAAAALAFAASGCANKAGPAADQAEANVATMTIDEVDAQLAKGTCQAVDANGDATRKHLGVLPGAVLLTDSETYATSELPADKAKPLVFYCANTSCGASHEAAERAITAGYTHVKVMPDGIAGWVKAGKQTKQI